MKKQKSIRRTTIELLIPMLLIGGLIMALPVGASTGDVKEVPQAEPATEMVGLGLFH